MIEHYLTTEQVANILQVHPFTILKFLKSGKLTGVKLGRVYRIKESDVHKFLEERTVNGKKSPEKGGEEASKKHNLVPPKPFKTEGEEPHYYII